MRVVVEPSASGLARQAAEFVADTMRAEPNIALALPTGRTPLGMYSELVRMHREEALDFSKVRVFNLDEYIAVPPSDARSFHHYLRGRLLDCVNVQAENVHLMCSTGDEQSCERYEEEIRAAGGIGLLVAGVGSNGHVAFNEPGSTVDSRTRVVDLAEATIEHMRGAWAPYPPPSRAVTMGVGTILEARRVLLLASGEKKRKPLEGLLHGPVTISNPVSALSLHPDLTVFVNFPL